MQPRYAAAMAGPRTKRTPRRVAAILKALRQGHGFHSAAEAAGIAYRTLCLWRAEDAEFRALTEDAADVAGDAMEHALYQRGIEGDDLAAFGWLRAHRPELYHRKQVVAVEPMLVNGDGSEQDEIVHFFLPDNHRHEPLQVAPATPSVIEAEPVVLQVVGGTAVEATAEQPAAEEARPRARIRI
jgi:hypothetical protein